MKNGSENKGFIALISVLLLSAMLFAAVLVNGLSIASVFDQASRKQYRTLAVEAALVCVDHAILELTHDYFYEVPSSTPVQYQSDNCEIISVTDSSGFAPGSGYKTLVVSGVAGGITATAQADLFLSGQKMTLLSQKITFQ